MFKKKNSRLNDQMESNIKFLSDEVVELKARVALLESNINCRISREKYGRVHEKEIPVATVVAELIRHLNLGVKYKEATEATVELGPE